MAEQFIPAGSARVTMGYTRTGDPEAMLNVFGVNTSLSGTAVCDAVKDSWVTALKGDQASDIFLAFVRAEMGTASGAPPYLTFEVTYNEAGGASAYAQAPPNVAVLVKKSTGVAGRQGRGRLFWPVVGESFSNNVGIVDSAVLADLQDGFTTFMDTLILNDADMVILHGSGQPITIPSVVTALTVDPKVATQRRRLRP